MAHVREQIRDAIISAATGLVTTGTRIFPSRVLPVQEADLPCLLVYTSEESTGIDSMRTGGARGLRRVCAVRIEAICQSAADLDDTADDICAEVETALAADITLGGLAKDLQLQEVQIGFRDDGGQPVAGVRMIFAVEYRTRENAPETAI